MVKQPPVYETITFDRPIREMPSKLKGMLQEYYLPEESTRFSLSDIFKINLFRRILRNGNIDRENSNLKIVLLNGDSYLVPYACVRRVLGQFPELDYGEIIRYGKWEDRNEALMNITRQFPNEKLTLIHNKRNIAYSAAKSKFIAIPNFEIAEIVEEKIPDAKEYSYKFICGVGMKINHSISGIEQIEQVGDWIYKITGRNYNTGKSAFRLLPSIMECRCLNLAAWSSIQSYPTKMIHIRDFNDVRQNVERSLDGIMNHKHNVFDRIRAARDTEVSEKDAQFYISSIVERLPKHTGRVLNAKIREKVSEGKINLLDVQRALSWVGTHTTSQGSQYNYQEILEDTAFAALMREAFDKVVAEQRKKLNAKEEGEYHKVEISGGDE